MRTYYAEVRYPEIVNSAPKHPFCNFVHANGSEMLQNTPKHHLRSNLGVFVRTYFTEVRYPETVSSAPKHPFCNFLHANGSEMLQITPKHRLWSIGDNWVCSCEHILRKFGTPKQCIRLRYTRFATLSVQTVAKCSKTLPNIVCGLLETIGCVCANIF